MTFRTCAIAFIAAATAAALTVTSSPALAQAEYVFKFTHPLPPVAAPPANFLIPWTERIKEQSGGRIDFEFFHANGLGGSSATLPDKVIDGIADIAWTLPSYTPGRFPKSEVFELPGLFAGPVATNQALWDYYLAELQDEFSDFHVLLLHVHAGQAFMSTKPIHTPDDLKGMPVRAPSNTGTLWLQAAGAIPVQAPVPQIPELLSRNTVEAVMIPFEIAPAFKVAELAKYNTTLPNDGRIHTSVFMFVMNKDAYESLPDDLKKVIDDNSGANLSVEVGEIWLDIEKRGEDVARDAGAEFFEFDEVGVSEIQRINDRAVTNWISENSGKFDAAGLVEEAKNLLSKYAN